MENRELLNSQKNVLYKLISRHALEPAYFEWSKVESKYYDYYVSKLSYKGTPYYFIFDIKEFEDLSSEPEVPFCRYSPSDSNMVKEEFCVDGWEEIIESCKKWLHYLKREINEPDLWGDMLKFQSQISISVPKIATNETISYTEYEMIDDRVANFFEAVKKQYDLTQEEIKLLNHKQDVILKAAKTQKSQGWMYLVIGVFMTIVMGIPSIQQDMETFKRLIEEFFGGIIHLFGQ